MSYRLGCHQACCFFGRKVLILAVLFGPTETQQTKYYCAPAGFCGSQAQFAQNNVHLGVLN